MKKIFIGSDHAGFGLKNRIVEFLKGQGHDVHDLGAHKMDEKDDYPDFILPVARKVAEKPDEYLGIVLGGSGQGEALAANKVKGVRAALYYGGPLDIVTLSRQHNLANVLSLGARFLSEEEAINAVGKWLSTPWSTEERHARRINKIKQTEK